MAGALRMGAREWALVVCLYILWGGAFFLAAVAVKEIAPFTLAFLRMALAALALGVTAWLMGYRLPHGRGVWAGFAFIGAVGTAMPFSLIYWGQTEITGGLASILNATTPFFTIVAAHFFTRDERFTWRRFLGVGAGFAGVAVIIGPSAFGIGDYSLLAEAAIVAAALCYAIVIVFAKRFRDLPPLIIACGQLSFGALTILPLALIFDDSMARPSPSLAAIAAVIGIALLCTALAFILYFEILRVAGATNVALVTLLVPVSAILLGGIILGESLEARQLAGLALIALGLMIIDGRLLKLVGRQARRASKAHDASGLASPPMLNEPQEP
ncbi:MAG: DMT family transporter [Rhodomicrobium sp.]|nr:DMT family transporter [Rhodomicrobium sp.]